MLSIQLSEVDPTAFALDEKELPTQEGGIITACISFETKIGHGYGLMRLRHALI